MSNPNKPTVVLNNPSYTASRLVEGQGNPLFEALQPLTIDKETIVNKLLTLPVKKKSELGLPPEDRIELPKRLEHFMFPFDQHVDVYSELAGAVRSGLKFRNPLTVEGQRLLYRNSAGAACLPAQAQGPLLLLRGASGLGKTTAISKALDTLAPGGAQVIVHSCYQDKPFHEVQIVYVSVQLDVSTERGAKSFLTKVGLQFESLLSSAKIQTPETTIFHRATATEPALRKQVIQLLKKYHVGILVIDDAQFLLQKDGVNKTITTFLVEMTASIGLPVFLVGTENAIKLIERNESLAGRIAAGGAVRMRRPPPPEFNSNGEPEKGDWNAFMDILQMFQYTKTPVKFDREFRLCLYDLSQAITRFAISIFVGAQIYAIRAGGGEQLNTDLLRKVSETRLEPVQGIIRALRTNDPECMAEYEQMYYDVEQSLQKKEKQELTKEKILALISNMSGFSEAVGAHLIGTKAAA